MAKLSEKEIRIETLILFALAKAFSEHSTFLTGSLKFKEKQSFTNAVKAVDWFIKTVEDSVTEDERKFLEGTGDVYHNINLEIRKQNR